MDFQRRIPNKLLIELAACCWTTTLSLISEARYPSGRRSRSVLTHAVVEAAARGLGVIQTETSDTRSMLVPVWEYGNVLFKIWPVVS